MREERLAPGKCIQDSDTTKPEMYSDMKHFNRETYEPGIVTQINTFNTQLRYREKKKN